MTDQDRIARLRLAQGEIVKKLDDPKTPSYSIAPLSNQLRLVERDLARLTAHEKIDDGLPKPELFGFVTAMAYRKWLRGPQVPARRASGNDYFAKQGEIFRSWSDAGFKLAPRPAPTGDDKVDRASLDAWIDQQRDELHRCLEKSPPTPAA